MKRLGLLAVALATVVLTPAAAGVSPVFRAWHARIGPALEKRMTGVSWHAGCPVGLDRLRLVTVRHWGFDGRVHTGRVVVNQDSTAAIVAVMRRLFAERFPIRRMRIVDNYRGNDFASIEADNTSAFNCRNATGSSHWSQHAYGHAIDVNPIENPYVSGGQTSHRASVPYLDRSRIRPGMAYSGGALVDAFKAVGWGWGGEWSGDVKDFQHFSINGG